MTITVCQEMVSKGARYDLVIDSLAEYTSVYHVGDTRIVFMFDDYVLKVPANERGIVNNKSEAEHYRSHWNEYMPLSPCSLYDYMLVEHKLALPVLHMERVKLIGSEGMENLPDWVGSVDGSQVGHLPDGTLVAYDV